MRYKLGKGEKLSKYEKEFVRKNNELIVLRTPEENAEIEETEKILESLI